MRSVPILRMAHMKEIAGFKTLSAHTSGADPLKIRQGKGINQIH